MKQVLTLLVFCCPLFAQEPSHRFLDKPARFTLSASAAIFAVDAAITCNKLGPNWHEQWLPTQSCPGVATFLGAELAAQTSAAFLLHRAGHHRLERVAEFICPAGSAAGIAYSLSHSRDPIPRRAVHSHR